MSQFDVKMTELADAIKVKNANISGKLSVQGMIDAVDGIVINHPSGEGADVSGVTATPADVLAGKAFVNSAGELVNGEIQTAEAPSTANNVVTIPAGYRSEEEKVTVGKAYEGDTTYTPGTADTILVRGTYIKTMLRIKGDVCLTPDNIRYGASIFDVVGTFTEDGDAEPEDIMDGKVAYVKGNPVYGTYKPQGSCSVDLSFITAEAGDIRSGKVGADANGNPVAGTLVPQSGGGGESCIEFYECASYTPDADAYTRYSFTLSGAPDELANGTYTQSEWVEDLPDTDEYVPIAKWINENGYSFVEEYGYGEFSYNIKNKDNNYIYSQESQQSERVTDYNSIVWVDGDTWEGVTLNFSAWQGEEIPATTEGWDGYKVTQDAATGLWSRTGEYKENMPAPFYTPQVGMIYSEDTSIACTALYSEADAHLVALYHFDKNHEDAVGNTSAKLYGKSVEDGGKFAGCLYGDTYNATQYDSAYYMAISGLPEMDAFTVEWWQKDERDYGDGGVFMWQPEENGKSRSTFLTVSLPNGSSHYIAGEWKHIAFVREAGSSTVTQYINGKNVGTVEYADVLGGRTVNFIGLSPTTTQAKMVRIDELAIYAAAKYSGDFTPSNSPIIM